jgi:hypothetical protein
VDTSAGEAAPVSLEIEFRLRGRTGHAVITCFDNEDPERWGYSFLEPPHDAVPAQGFPVCAARLRYDGEGYAAVMGWIQVVRSIGAAGDPRVGYLVDRPPMFASSGMPFAYFAPRPDFFDAPSMSSRDGEVQWQADCFLCFCPGGGIRPVAAALFGFTWGYELYNGEVRPRSLGRLPGSAWDRHLDLLRQECPAWTFLKGFHDEAGNLAE